MQEAESHVKVLLASHRLTAFVAKSLAEASRHIEMEEEVVQQAVEWLTQLQQADGSFKEVGTVNNEAMQGGSGKGVSLTAYVLIALLTVEVREMGGREAERRRKEREERKKEREEERGGRREEGEEKEKRKGKRERRSKKEREKKRHPGMRMEKIEVENKRKRERKSGKVERERMSNEKKGNIGATILLLYLCNIFYLLM